MVAQMHLAGRRLDRRAGRGERVVRAVHAALGRRLLVLLYGHEVLLIGPGREALPGVIRRTAPLPVRARCPFAGGKKPASLAFRGPAPSRPMAVAASMWRAAAPAAMRAAARPRPDP